MDKELIHIVYPLKKSSVGDSDEIKYSLRSLEKHLKDPFDVTIIGYKPKWLDITKVKYIPSDETDNKENNILTSYLMAVNMYSEFVVFHDDYFLNNDVYYEDLKQTRYLQDFHNVKQFGPRKFQQGLKLCFEEVTEAGYRGLNYCTHTPMYFKSDIVKQVVDKFDLLNRYFVSFESYYYNFIKAEKTAKQVDDVKVARYNAKLFRDKDAEGKLFVNFDEKGMLSGIYNYIMRKFPEKSKFEL